MKSPLEQFVTVEERGDGIYAKISRSDRDTLNLDVILKAMENSIVMNFNAEQFKDVFTRARGAFEKVSPIFEYYDEELENYLSVNITSIKASIKISQTLTIKGKLLNEHQLLHFLKKKNIVFGIDMGVLSRLLTESVYDNYVDIAFATPPVNGTDAKIEMKVSLSSEIKPEIKSDGSVDYRSIQTFTSVEKGDLLAVKIPPGSGKPGIAVTGELIPAQTGKDIKLLGGRNTEVSSDGMQLKSMVTGILLFEDALLHVIELLNIESDVDFSVGNIKYSGDVLINGSVKPGFIVEADGSIQIKGSVESAKIISRSGSVIIDKGIIGKGDTFITAKKGINVAFAQDTHLSTEGTLVCEKYLLHCTCICDIFEGNGPQACIIGGEIKASHSITIRTCGSDKGIPTKMIVYDKNKSLILKKIQELNELHDKLSNERQPIEKQLRTKAALLKKAGEGVSDRSREEIKKWIDAYNILKKKISYVEGKIKELSQINLNSYEENGFIIVRENCYPGSEIVLYDAMLPIKSIIVNKRFVIKSKSIIIEG